MPQGNALRPVSNATMDTSMPSGSSEVSDGYTPRNVVSIGGMMLRVVEDTPLATMIKVKQIPVRELVWMRIIDLL